MIEICEYITPNGKSPFGEWLSNLRDSKAKAKILTRLNRVSVGHFCDHKYLRDGMYELRLSYANIRIYYGKEGNTIILLLCSAKKSNQCQDIKRAVKYWFEHTGE